MKNKTMNKAVIFTTDDWIIIYVDGKLVWNMHWPNPMRLLESMGYEVEQHEYSEQDYYDYPFYQNPPKELPDEIA